MTSFPVFPFDGQRVDYIADAPGGIVWTFRWREAAVGSYKWEFIGGGALWNRATASFTPTSTTYAVTTFPPSITVPLAGEYMIRHGAKIVNGGTSVADVCSVTIKLGAAAAGDNESIVFAHAASAATQGISGATEFTAQLAASAVCVEYAKTVNSADAISLRWLEIIPIRVT